MFVYRAEVVPFNINYTDNFDGIIFLLFFFYMLGTFITIILSSYFLLYVKNLILTGLSYMMKIVHGIELIALI